MKNLKVFTSNFNGVWLGGSALIIAETKRKAYNMLKKELKEHGIGEDLTMDNILEVDMTKPSCYVLDNGDY